MKWKTCSVEAGGGIGKLRRFAGVSEAGACSRKILSVAKDQLPYATISQRFYPFPPA
jgi:hypothetical protein